MHCSRIKKKIVINGSAAVSGRRTKKDVENQNALKCTVNSVTITAFLVALLLFALLFYDVALFPFFIESSLFGINKRINALLTCRMWRKFCDS